MAEPILEVEDLTIEFQLKEGGCALLAGSCFRLTGVKPSVLSANMDPGKR